MHLAVNNAALPPGPEWLSRIAAQGIEGVELAPHATWADPWLGLHAAEVERCRRALRQAQLCAIGIRLDDEDLTGLGWLHDAEARQLTLAHLVHLSAVCRDLGGRTLVLAGPRWRGQLPVARAWRLTRDFLLDVLWRIERHGTMLCVAPIAPRLGDFCNSANDCRILSDALEHPLLGLELNAEALLANQEIGRHAVFASHYGRLESFVANEPDGAPFSSSGAIDHAALRRHLSAGGYRDWVSLVQRRCDPAIFEHALAEFVRLYRRPDNLSMHAHQSAARSF